MILELTALLLIITMHAHKFVKVDRLTYVMSDERLTAS